MRSQAPLIFLIFRAYELISASVRVAARESIAFSFAANRYRAANGQFMKTATGASTLQLTSAVETAASATTEGALDDDEPHP